MLVLSGIAVIALGFLLRFNPLLVIVGSALVSALAEGLPAVRALSEELSVGVRQRATGVSG